MRRHLNTISSTNDAAREWARDHAPHFSVVTAREQTAGRGRRGRDWVSLPNRGLYFSLILREQPLEAAPKLTMLLSLATCRAVDELTGLRAQVKWPNDVLLNERKVAGVLCEADPEFCVCGLGLNLNFQREELPSRVVFPASSLRIETGRDFEFEVALSVLLREFQTLHEAFARGEWETLRLAWERRCFGLGREVVVRDASGEWRGVALMTDTSGALLVGTPNGMRRIIAGDVSF